MKCLSIQYENVNRGHAVTIIATNVQNGISSRIHKPGDIAAIVSRFIDNCLLYARPDHTQMLLQLVFQMFQKIIQSGLHLSFCCEFFDESVSSEIFKFVQILKIKCNSLCTDPFP